MVFYLNLLAMLVELHHGDSFCGDSDTRMFFGTGAHKSVPKVEVLWPGGDRQTFTDVATNRMYHVEQGRDELLPDEPQR